MRIVLLFCHGGSLHKGCWSPILHRLRSSSLLKRVSCELIAIDWRYHGENACDDEPATLFYESNYPQQPRVAHPAANWPQWAPEQLVETIANLQVDDVALNRTTQIIGIGHSMGAATLLQVEVMYPGTFEGLVLFEPTLAFECKIFGGAKWASSMLVTATLAREEEWKTKEDAIAYAKNARAYRRWHPEALDAFLEGGLKPSRDGHSVRLAIPLLHEAALYCHEVTNFTHKQLSRIECRVAIEYGALTNIFNVFGVHEVVETFPTTFSLGEALPNVSHQMVMDAPQECAERILERLQLFPVFQAHLTSRL